MKSKLATSPRIGTFFFAGTTHALGVDVHEGPVCPLATAASTLNSRPAIWQQLSLRLKSHKNNFKNHILYYISKQTSRVEMGTDFTTVVPVEYIWKG